MSTQPPVIPSIPPVVQPLQSVSPVTISWELNESERLTLMRTLSMFKAVRKDAKNADPKVSRPALVRLAAVMSYVGGFVDGKGCTGYHQGLMGIQQVFLQQLDQEALLNEFETAIEDAVSPTRSTKASAGLVAAIGIVFLGVGLILQALDK